ncbi:hypothetical protein SAY87_015613 [Trapa incisa]|uniref:Helicase protein MOM1 n=1 Tax=Trapa incisa TaxID=236973 RepID=A0AAN7QUS4_9MYRT|nr:hypothetical protein SAY87_015613 [Trapa incisa]
MTNNSGLKEKITDEYPIVRRSSARLASASVSAVEDSSGLRRSTRVKTSNEIGDPENQTTLKPGQSVKKQLTQSLLRRSERCKKQCSSLSSSSTKNSEEQSGNSVSCPKKMEEVKKGNSMKKSTEIAKEVSVINYPETKSAQTEKLWMAARAYRVLFRKQEKKDKLSGSANHSSSNVSDVCRPRITVLAIGNISASPISYEEISSPRKSTAGDCTNSKSHNSKELDPPDNGQEIFSLISKENIFTYQHHNPENVNNFQSPVNQEIESFPSPKHREDSIRNGRSSGGSGFMDMDPLVVVDASAVANCKYNTQAHLPSDSADNFYVEEDGMNLKRKSRELEADIDPRGGGNLIQNGTECLICKHSGSLLSCHGKDCGRSFHLSCLNPPLKVVPSGFWHCPACDVREMESSDANGVRVQKQSTISGCGVESSRFLEYWVPTQLSNIQLEQYCATLLSNTHSLRSSSRTDPVGALPKILFSARKCCDHPYLVDTDLQQLLVKDLPVDQYLDVGIKASGKLQLLDKLLLELRNRGLRALILFQSTGSLGRDSISIGDILDDFLRQRYGADSYERIDGDVARSKKVTAMNNYNTDLRRFVFMLEARACLPSIKLVSVDVVVIFGSDWNPANDIRNLQKVQLESQFEQIKIFRLYTSCTVEEKVLINAKNGESLPVLNAHPNYCQSLLMWGAKSLFDELQEFHHLSGASPSAASYDQSQAGDVMIELLSMLPENDENSIHPQSSSCLLISRALQVHGPQIYYSKETLLLGESKIQFHAEELPQIFWTKLLEGKAPDWKYSSVSQQRYRKRVQSNGNQYTEKDECNGVRKKRKNVAENNVDLYSKKKRKNENKQAAFGKEVDSGPVELTSLEKGVVEVSEGNIDGSYELRTLRDAQSHLHLILKPEISRLCEALDLEGEVKDMVDNFFDYVINNRVVNQEPATILQGFQLALCWTAASLVKWKIDHKKSLALARNHLCYGCSEGEAEGVYDILRGLKKPFLHHRENLKSVCTTRAPEIVDEVLTEKNLSLSNKGNIEIEDSPLNQESSDKDVIGSPILGDREAPFNTKEIQGKYSEQMEKLLKEQEEERNKIYKNFEVTKGELENEYSLEVFFITHIHKDDSLRTEKLKVLEDEHARKIRECENQMSIRLKELKECQPAARNNAQQKEASSGGFEHQSQVDHVGSISDSQNQVGIVQTNEGEAAQQAHLSEAAADNEEPAQCQPENAHIQDNRNVQLFSSGEQVTDGPTLGAIVPDGVDTAPENLSGSKSTYELREDSADRPMSGAAPDGTDTVPEHELDEVESALPDGRDTAKEVENAYEQHEDPDSPTPVGYQGQLVDNPTSYQDASIPPNQGHTCGLHEENASLQIIHMAPDSRTVEVSDQPFPEGTEVAVQVACPLHASQQTIDRPPDSRNVEASDQPCLDVLGTYVAIQVPCSSHVSQQTIDMPPDASMPSDQPCPEPSGAEVSMQAPCPTLSPQTDDGIAHQWREERLNTQNALNQFTQEPWIPLDPQMAATPLTRLSSLSSATQMALLNSSDPLQNELDRLRLESDHTTRVYLDTKSKLKADCEKEIEVMLAQIRGKYDAKFKEADTEYLLKRNELLENHNKVMKNKILAEAFRRKCVDLRSSAAQAAQQDAMSSIAQQLSSSSSQASPLFNPRPPSSVNHTAIPHPVIMQGPQPMRPDASVQVMSTSASMCTPWSISGWFPSPFNNIQGQSEVRASLRNLQSFRPILPAPPHRALPPWPTGYTSTPITSFYPSSVTNMSLRSAQRSGVLQHDHLDAPSASPASTGYALDLLTSISRQNLLNAFQPPPLNSTVQGSSEAQEPNIGNSNTAQVLCLSDDD